MGLPLAVMAGGCPDPRGTAKAIDRRVSSPETASSSIAFGKPCVSTPVLSEAQWAGAVA